MNGQDLKNSILQLAIQGKLVEQRAEEGTAKELIEKIKAEKEQLIKEKKIKKEKPLPEITEEEIPFEIPESWEWVRLGEIFEVVMGQSPKGNSVFEGNNGIEFHQGKVFFGRDYLKESNLYTNMPTKIVESNTALLCVRAPVGIVNITERRICIGRGLCAINTFCNIDERFVMYLLRAFKKSFIKKATGTTFKAITGEVVKNQIIPLPPLEEEKRIVTKIEELMPYIDQYDKAYTKVEALNKKFPEDMQKAILQYAIQGKLAEQRAEEGTAEELYKQIQEEKAQLIKEKKIKKEKALPEISEEEIPFEIPESWKWVRLGDIGSTNIGLTYKPQNISSEGTIVLRSSNIQNGKLSYDDIVKVDINIPENKMCLKGDILICARNGSKRLVGKAAIIDEDNMSFGAFMAIYRSCCNEYILHVINSAYFRNSLLAETGTTTINQITQNMLKNFIIPLPPLEEQKRIVEKIEEMLPYCKQLIK